MEWHIDGNTLPVGTIYCIGRNYAAHAAEMGAPVPTEPLVFLKPASAIVPSGTTVFCPPFSQQLEYEGEIVAILGKPLFCATFAEAEAAIAGYAAGIDLTLRDVQAEAKRSGQPWAVAKGFYRSAPVSPVIAASAVQLPLEIHLLVNGESRQKGSTEQMIWQIPQLVVYLSKIFQLLPGDAVFTGTPAGVGAVKVGDRITAKLQQGTTVYTEVEVTVGESPCSVPLF